VRHGCGQLRVRRQCVVDRCAYRSRHIGDSEREDADHASCGAADAAQAVAEDDSGQARRPPKEKGVRFGLKSIDS
jgi:hypothetical protein